MTITHVDHRFRAMGGPCRLRFDCEDDPLSRIIIAEVEAEVQRLERKYSRYLPDSLTSRINAGAGTCPVAIDPETASLLGFAHTLWRESGGLFDLTAGVLRRAWDFKTGQLPAQSRIDELLPLVGWDRFEWDDSSASLPLPGMEIDFGGCVKEYATDSAASALTRHGIERGLVDLAGDMAVVGPHSLTAPWRVGINHPRQPGAAIAHIDLGEGGLASSGDYERCLIINKRRYGHILNPATGWPVQGLVAVSVAAPQCLVAGGSATIGMLKPMDQAIAWLEELGLPWLAVDSDLHCHRSQL